MDSISAFPWDIIVRSWDSFWHISSILLEGLANVIGLELELAFASLLASSSSSSSVSSGHWNCCTVKENIVYLNRRIWKIFEILHDVFLVFATASAGPFPNAVLDSCCLSKVEGNSVSLRDNCLLNGEFPVACNPPKPLKDVCLCSIKSVAWGRAIANGFSVFSTGATGGGGWLGFST